MAVHFREKIRIMSKSKSKSKGNKASGIMKRKLFLLLSLLFVSSVRASLDTLPSPFGVTASLHRGSSEPLVRLHFTMPPDHVIYAERLRFETEDGTTLSP